MLLKTRREICKYIGEDVHDFLALVENSNLPAWRTKINGNWKARTVDLDKWIGIQAERFIGRSITRDQPGSSPNPS